MRIELPSGTPAELARPDGEAARGLVLIPDIMGLRPLFDDWCARLAAEQGWVVCAPELYPGREQLAVEERLAAAGTLVDADVLGDVVAAADATGCEVVNVAGFCMGGMYALKAVGTGRFHRSCPFYGMITVPEDWRSAGQGEPLTALAEGDPNSVLAVCGSADPYTPPDDIAALEATGATVVVYEGAEHGFVHDPARPAHRVDDAADAWQRVLAWLHG